MESYLHPHEVRDVGQAWHPGAVCLTESRQLGSDALRAALVCGMRSPPGKASESLSQHVLESVSTFVSHCVWKKCIYECFSVCKEFVNQCQFI